MTFSFFGKKEKEPEKVEPYIDKVMQLSHSELTLRFDKTTGVTTPISFTTPLVKVNVYPRCWVCPEDSVIDPEFDDILKSKIPYDSKDRRDKFISDMNTLLNVFNKTFRTYDVDDMLRVRIYRYLKTFEVWEDGVEMVNIFMESTVEWLMLQEQKFEALSSQEPKMMLSEAEYETILRSMQRLNTTK